MSTSVLPSSTTSADPKDTRGDWNLAAIRAAEKITLARLALRADPGEVEEKDVPAAYAALNLLDATIADLMQLADAIDGGHVVPGVTEQ